MLLHPQWYVLQNGICGGELGEGGPHEDMIIEP